jgi:hypothetical protein
MNAQLDAAVTEGKWRTVLVHGFVNGGDGAYQPVALDEFLATVQHAKDVGLWVDSVLNIAAYWRGQTAFSAATTASDGERTTWTWTLPAHFPPGRYLRVTVDGGTLTQGDTTLVWDEHGYYEVALDARTLTLSP